MKRLFRVLGRSVLVLLSFGGVIIYTSFPNFVISLKPVVSFVGMLEGVKVEVGDRVTGNIQHCFDYFASQSSYTRYKDGSRSGDRKSGSCYLIPTGNEDFVDLKNREADTVALNKLTKENFEYLVEGAEPTMAIFMQGAVHLLEAELTECYNEYLESLGFTKEEIKAMRAPLMVGYTSLWAAWAVFGIGIVLTLLAIWILVHKYKRDLNGSGLPKAEDLPRS